MKKILIAAALTQCNYSPIATEPTPYRCAPVSNENWRKPGKRKAPKQK